MDPWDIESCNKPKLSPLSPEISLHFGCTPFPFFGLKQSFIIFFTYLSLRKIVVLDLSFKQKNRIDSDKK